ncbi:MAG: [protein-PII] uridylyltransferase [Pseudomonadales bacterium]
MLVPALALDPLPTAHLDTLNAAPNAEAYKNIIATAQRHFDAAFLANEDIRKLIAARAALIDTVLRAAWLHFTPADQSFAGLVAVGGYGRGELHPHSDIDLLILLERASNVPPELNIASFVTFLWDIGLQIGHSVRSIRQCRENARAEISIATNLMESRLIAGPEKVFDAMRKQVGPNKIWPDQAFFKAKWDEQKGRHEKYADSEYNLEPNVKSSPGGLRDIQTIGWVTKRHFDASDIDALVEQGFVYREEFEQLREGECFLWRVRYGLHMLSHRCEDRLLFDYQRQLAPIFGFEDGRQGLAVEQFMQVYYRWAMQLGLLNEILMQHFDDAILQACKPETVLNINKRFRVRNDYIEVTNVKVFEKKPSAFLELFVILARREAISGVRASTIRLVRQNLHLIDAKFRTDSRNNALFMRLLGSQNKVARQLRRMNRYGVLGAYLPEFGRIVGQMQHDLFHIYTVDAHTLNVIKNMRRFSYPEATEYFPVAAKVVKRLPKIEMLYVAGLYHDIAKGRGGNHSELGAEDVRLFCQQHDCSAADTNLAVWLVENHLVMSSIAQRQDIADPDVIHKFAHRVGDQTSLDYLYALTVADINATNPTLWNSWRASLLRQLYFATKRALRRGLENQVDLQENIAATREAAIAKLATKGHSSEQVLALWADLGDDYFLRENSNDIVWHAELIAEQQCNNSPLVAIKESSHAKSEGATQIFVYTRNQDYIFAICAATLEQLDLNIQDARIFVSRNGFTLDTFFVLDKEGLPIGDDPARVKEIQRVLTSELQNSAAVAGTVQRRTPRKLKLFATPTVVKVSQDHSRGHTVLEVITPDRPGLLARLGQIFLSFDVKLVNAKITTLGERVEDVFFITDMHNQPITDPGRCERIRVDICRQLDAEASKHDKAAQNR